MVQEVVERRKIRLRMSLTNLMEFKKDHFEERAIPLYRAIGIEINDHSFNKDSEFYQDMWTTWQIARGEKKSVFPNKGYDDLMKMRYVVNSLKNLYNRIAVNGRIIPSSYIKPYNAVYKWSSIYEFAMDLADIRLRAYQKEWISIAEALMLGGYKNKNSIIFDIETNDLHSKSEGNKGTTYIDSEHFVKLLEERGRLYWHSIMEQTTT
jgi:hypothetical protein